MNLCTEHERDLKSALLWYPPVHLELWLTYSSACGTKEKKTNYFLSCDAQSG